MRRWLAGVWLLARVLVLALVPVLTTNLALAAPAAGTQISNQATGRFIDANGTPRTHLSNVVQTAVGQVASFTLTASSVKAAQPGAQAFVAHTLTNTGNGSDSFSLALTDLPGGFGFTALQLFADANADGLPDNNAPLASSGALPPGGVFRFVAAGGVPAGAQAGSGDQWRIDATSAADATRTTTGAAPSVPALVDSINVLAGPELQLTKSVSAPSAAPGDTLAYRLVLRNVGGSSATSGPNVLINGVAATPLLMRDAIPANTRLVAVTTTRPAGANLLYHRVGDGEHSYTTAAPADLSVVDAVALSLAALDAGANVDFGFSVRLNVNAAHNGSGAIVNTARGYFADSVNPGVRSIVSNAAATTVAAARASIRNYTAPNHATPADYTRLGGTLYLRADAAACNDSAASAEMRVAVVTGPNGEREAFIATETGPNTGVFTLEPVPTRNAAPVAGNGIVEAPSGATIGVELLGCGRSIVSELVLVDPAGTVFDSRSNAAVGGAGVALHVADTRGGCSDTLASVRRIVDGRIEPAPNPVVTGGDGRFEFELTAPGEYCVRVTPPGGYAFPSQVAAGELPPGRTISSTGATTGGSYGGAFSVGPSTGPVTLDMPLDALALSGLFVDKRASRATVEIADVLDYTIRVRNNAARALSGPGVELTDSLPAGFAYQPGSARRDGQPTAEPAGGRGPQLRFNLGTIESGAQVQLTYRVRVGPGALEGDGTNRAQAAFGAMQSNLAAARVTVQGGVFTTRGYIVGRVWLDCNRNRVQDDGELGIPGVRIYLEDGSSAITDGEGKYSFYGVTPRTHVVKLDKTSMPEGAELIALSNRHAGDAGSVFADVKNGELFKANFAEASCAAPVRRAVELRRAQPEPLTADIAESERTLARRLEADAQPRPSGDVKGQPASGTLGTRSAVAAAGYTPLQPAPGAPLTLGPASGPVAKLPSVDLETLLPGLDAKFGFIDLADGATLPTTQANVRIKGTAGAEFKLSVNGADVAATRIGKRSVLAERRLQAWEFIGVDLKPGANRLVARQIDPFGNERGTVSISVIAPDRLARLEWRLPSAAIADGRSIARVVLELKDAKGVAVTARTPVTLEASHGRWDVEDLDPRESGVQVFIEGGRAEFALAAPDAPVGAILRAASGTLQAEAQFDFLPDLRPMIAAGVIEGVLNLRKLDSQALVPARRQDGFEQELRHLSRSENGKVDGGVRAALFLKGRVKGEYLLTLAYDSDKATRERLFRDIQPDEFYPVYGDSSVRGFDAQSTSRLYVRVDKDKSYLLYGDYSTQQPSQARRLATYSRSLTGVKQHYENERVSVNAFASRDSARQVIDEIRANGTSGPYRLSAAQPIDNSERVEILVRDRSQPGVVLKAVVQTRFTDYEIEPLSGALIFKGPIPSLDPQFNPKSIRVTYEVDQGGASFWVAGVDAQVRINDRVEVGAVAVEDRNPQDPARLVGANATVRIAEKTFVTGEVAHSDKASLGSGAARRVELRHDDKTVQASAFVARTDAAFDNPGAYLSRGRAEAGAKVSYRLNEATLVRGEGLRTEDVVTGGRREGAFVSVERSLGEHLRGEIGVRHGKETGVPANLASAGAGLPNAFTSVRAKLSGQLPSWPQAGVFAEYEQDVHDSGRRIAAIGGDYQIANRGRLYLRHELVSSLSGPYALNGSQKQNATVLGVDTEYMKDGRMFSEYRVRDAYSGAETEAAIGLRNQWHLAKGLAVTTGFERVHSLDGAGTDESSALSLGIDYTADERWKGTARLELRNGATSDSVLSTLGAAIKLDRNWTALARNALAITRNKGALVGQRVQDRLQLGAAYRDTATDVWSALGRIEHRLEKDDTQPGQQTERRVDIVSLHLNVQPTRPLLLSSRAASKWGVDLSNGLQSRYSAHLLGARLTYDLNERWDVGVAGNALFSGDLRSRQIGVGPEVGYLVSGNLWLSAGYNFFGFMDKDLGGADHTTGGAFIRLRFKFDEDLFSAGGGKPTSRTKSEAPQ